VIEDYPVDTIRDNDKILVQAIRHHNLIAVITQLRLRD
jgi:hypothetical protein